MGIFRELIGLFLIVIAWSGIFGMSAEFQLILFILGFDMMSLIPKIAIFIMDFFFEISGAGWILLLAVAAEALIHFLKLKPVFGYVLKPLAVFMIIYASDISATFALAVAGIDLLLNVSKKYI